MALDVSHNLFVAPFEVEEGLAQLERIEGAMRVGHTRSLSLAAEARCWHIPTFRGTAPFRQHLKVKQKRLTQLGMSRDRQQ